MQRVNWEWLGGFDPQLAQLQSGQYSRSDLLSSGQSTPRSDIDRPAKHSTRYVLEETGSKGTLLDRVAALEQKLAFINWVNHLNKRFFVQLGRLFIRCCCSWRISPLIWTANMWNWGYFLFSEILQHNWFEHCGYCSTLLHLTTTWQLPKYLQLLRTSVLNQI